ncbi:MAG: hypothetical protein Q9167_003592 [Letrouitia subvulpina]
MEREVSDTSSLKRNHSPSRIPANKCSRLSRVNFRLPWEPPGWCDPDTFPRHRELSGTIKEHEPEEWAEWFQPAFKGLLYYVPKASYISREHELEKGDNKMGHKKSEDDKILKGSEIQYDAQHQINNDTRAFMEMKKRLEILGKARAEKEKKFPPEPSDIYYLGVNRDLAKLYWPTRLVNIKTGSVEHDGNFAYGVELPKYIIGSYIWSPENLPKYPRLKRRKREVLSVGDGERDYRDDTWEYCTEHFNAVVDLIQEATSRVTETPKFWIIDIDEYSGVEYENIYPQPDLSGFKESRKQYLKEVYYLLVAEAHLMSIEYVWIDSLCIDQASHLDKVKEIPKMADYYSNATRCVVVSEMLRRGYSHRLEHLGHDFLNPALDDDFPLSTLTKERKRCCGLEDEVLGWLAGFHQLRLWVFQETYLATSIVHRGRNIRLNTQDLIRSGIGLPESRSFEQLQSYHRQVYRNLLPTYGTGSELIAPLTPNYCMSLVKKQARTAFKEQDFICGILGLFPQDVRYAIPLEIDASLPAFSAMLLYARVFVGDIRALLPDEAQAEGL